MKAKDSGHMSGNKREYGFSLWWNDEGTEQEQEKEEKKNTPNEEGIAVKTTATAFSVDAMHKQKGERIKKKQTTKQNEVKNIEIFKRNDRRTWSN